MSYKQNAKRILGQSLIWAAAILSSALLLGESEAYSTYMLLLVVLAMTSIALDPAYRETARIEGRYICRLSGIGGKKKSQE